MSAALRDAYGQIAVRALGAAVVTEQAGLHEKAVFHVYHAFESIGGALAAARNVAYPRSAHSAKLNVFRTLAQRYPFRYAMASLAIALASLRSRALYPERADGGVIPPHIDIAPTHAFRLRRRVVGLVAAVRRVL